MTGQDLFAKLFSTLLKIGPSEKNLELYQQIQSSLSDFVLVDSFYQLKKNNKAEGLALELMLFNKQEILDIVFTRTTTDFITILTKSVNMVYIETSFGENVNAQGQTTSVDMLNFTISQGDNSRTLVYSMEIKRFSEINKIKANLLNILAK